MPARSVLSAFQSAQPRPRSHVASSTAIAARNASRASPRRTVQAMTRSHAGSPTPHWPKSITALSRPSSSSRFPGATSPWNHRGGPAHRAPRAASHATAAAAPSIADPDSAIARRVSSS